MANGKVGLVEIFSSVQGEGRNTGRHAVFVRLAGCNLSCVFADGAVCDTPYQRANLKYTVPEVMAQVLDLAGGLVPGRVEEAPMCIFTGGEPTLAPAFDQLARAALEAGFYVAVETNGTRWRDGLLLCHWICVSPKDTVAQGSTMLYHNQHPGSPALDSRVVEYLEFLADTRHEYRHVISGPEEPVPPWRPAFRHYVSPAVLADGSGQEWKQHGFPGFVPGALERCQEIVWADPRWRISTQVHKLWGVR